MQVLMKERMNMLIDFDGLTIIIGIVIYIVSAEQTENT